eukprot:6118574-Amphidinium_carterae.1
MAPVLIARLLWSEELSNRPVVWFTDSTVVLDAAVKGFSKVPFLRACLHRFAREDALSPSLAWFAR